MAECGKFVEPRSPEGRVISGAAYPCRLDPDHKGPCWAREVKSSEAARAKWLQDNVKVPFPEAPPLTAFQSKPHGFTWDDQLKDRPETIWAETPNFRQDDTVPSVVARVEGPDSGPDVPVVKVINLSDDDLPEELEDEGPPEFYRDLNKGDVYQSEESVGSTPPIPTWREGTQAAQDRAVEAMSPTEAASAAKENERIAQHAFIEVAHWLQDNISNVPLDVIVSMDLIKRYLFTSG